VRGEGVSAVCDDGAAWVACTSARHGPVCVLLMRMARNARSRAAAACVLHRMRAPGRRMAQHTCLLALHARMVPHLEARNQGRLAANADGGAAGAVLRLLALRVERQRAAARRGGRRSGRGQVARGRHDGWSRRCEGQQGAARPVAAAPACRTWASRPQAQALQRSRGWRREARAETPGPPHWRRALRFQQLRAQRRPGWQPPVHPAPPRRAQGA
jgi:hypothetical protein